MCALPIEMYYKTSRLHTGPGSSDTVGVVRPRASLAFPQVPSLEPGITHPVRQNAIFEPMMQLRTIGQTRAESGTSRSTRRGIGMTQNRQP